MGRRLIPMHDEPKEKEQPSRKAACNEEKKS
jgi:hypothetical protein